MLKVNAHVALCLSDMSDIGFELVFYIKAAISESMHVSINYLYVNIFKWLCQDGIINGAAGALAHA